MNKFRIIAFTTVMIAISFTFVTLISGNLNTDAHHHKSVEVRSSEDQGADVAKLAMESAKAQQSKTPQPTKDPKPQQIHYIIKEGDTLSGIFSQLSIPYSTVQDISSVDVDHLHLDMLVPGQQLDVLVDNHGQLLNLTYHISLAEQAVYSRDKDGTFSYVFKEQPGEWKETLYSGEIVGSFSVSAIKQGLTSSQVSNITKVFRDKIDFSKGLRSGDRFEVLVDEQFLGERATGNSEIKAISFHLARGDVSAFLAKDGRFYDRQGKSLERAFNRYPIDKQFRRITSPFNPNRRHPVTGRIMPHNGTDFATPLGSPIYSTGDGEVIAVRNHPYAGKYLVIEHNSIYKTRYLHLSKFLVKKGDHVKRGQKIALSGATGRVTGPHLHFEVLVRNHPVDSMKADLPIATSVPKEDRKQFIANIAEFDAMSKAEQLDS